MREGWSHRTAQPSSDPTALAGSNALPFLISGTPGISRSTPSRVASGRTRETRISRLAPVVSLTASEVTCHWTPSGARAGSRGA